MKIFTMFTKEGRVDVPLKDNQAVEAAQIMKNPLTNIVEKVREMNDLSNKLTKAQLDAVAQTIEKVEFKDVDGRTIRLIKDAGNAIQVIGKEEAAPEHSPEDQAEFDKERKEHPDFTDEQIWQIVADHKVADEKEEAPEASPKDTARNEAGKPVKPAWSAPVQAPKAPVKAEGSDDKKIAIEHIKTGVPMKHQDQAKTYVNSDKFKEDVARHTDEHDKERQTLGYTRGGHPAVRAVNEHLLPLMTKAERMDYLRDAAGMLAKGGPGSGRHSEGLTGDAKVAHESRVQDILSHYKNNPDTGRKPWHVAEVASKMPWAEKATLQEHISAISEAHHRLSSLNYKE